MPQPRGFSILTDPAERAPVVHDTLTCSHCQKILILAPGKSVSTYLIRRADGTVVERPGAHCGRCDKAICLTCYHDGRCRPWEQQLEEMEARARFLAAVGD